MPDIVFETELRLEVARILNALQEVKSGQDVFDALIEVPMSNLIEMNEMIAHILNHKIKHLDASEDK